MNNSKIKFSADGVIYKPKKQNWFPVEDNDWERLKKMLSKIYPPSKIYYTLAAIFLSVCGSGMLSLFFLETNNFKIKVTAIAICATTGIIGFVLLGLDKILKKGSTIIVDDILEEMKQIETRCERPEGEEETEKRDLLDWAKENL